MSCESESESFRLDKDSLSSEKTINNEEMRSTEAHPNEPQQIPLNYIIAKGSEGQLEMALARISEEIKKGRPELIANKVLHYRLMRLYFHSYKLLDEKEGQQEYILFLLSLLA